MQVNGLTDATSIAAEYYHSLALKQDGTVWAWGYNSDGQLGDGTMTWRYTPVQASGLTNVTSIAAGRNHSIALKQDGTVWAWGSNGYGQLGNVNNIYSFLTAKVSGFTDAIAIAAGGRHSLALKQDGTVWACGDNMYGQLGDGTSGAVTFPAKNSGLMDATFIAAGNNHSLAIKQDGTVLACGDNFSGQLGDGTCTNRSTPVQVTGLTDATSIAVGYSHSLAAKQDGTVWAWGKNYNGCLGDGTTTNRTTPVQVSLLTNVKTISTKGYHSLAQKHDGTVCAWGQNDCGQLGDGTTTDRTTPVQVSGLTDVIAVSAGSSHNLVLKQDGTVWAWGGNYYGQLGDGTTTNRPAPVQVSGLTDVIAISAGSSHNLALKQDGTVWAWGYNYMNVTIGDGVSGSRLTPVQVSYLTDVTAISAGGHSLALKQDGSVWAWGSNSRGQLGDGTAINRATPVQVSNLTNISAIFTGGNNSFAIGHSGAVWAWGDNYYGQLGNGGVGLRTGPIQCFTEPITYRDTAPFEAPLVSLSQTEPIGLNAEFSGGNDTTWLRIESERNRTFMFTGMETAGVIVQVYELPEPAPSSPDASDLEEKPLNADDEAWLLKDETYYVKLTQEPSAQSGGSLTIEPMGMNAAPTAWDLQYQRIVGLNHPRPISMTYGLGSYNQFVSTTPLAPGQEWTYLKLTALYNAPYDIKVYKYAGDPYDDDVIYPDEDPGGYNPAGPAKKGAFVGYISGIQYKGNVDGDADDNTKLATSKGLSINQIENALTGLYGGTPQRMEDVWLYGWKGVPYEWIGTGNPIPSEVPDMETVIHNYILWNGKVVGANGSTSTLPAGSYMIVLEPRPSELSVEGYLPFKAVTDKSPTELAQQAKNLRDPLKFKFGDPVDSVSGNFSWSYTDLKLEGKYPLEFSRTYNSFNGEKQFGLGYGWSHTYSYRVRLLYTYAGVTLPDGQSVNFELDYDGQFKRTPESPYEFTRTASGYLLVNRLTLEEAHFDQNGYLSKLVNPLGSVTAVNVADGKIQSVSNTSGSFAFTYDGDNIIKVTDSANRVVTFSYDGNGDLVSVKNPDFSVSSPNTDTFSYDYDSDHNLTEVTDLNGHVYLINQYDSDRRVTMQKMPERADMEFLYDIQGPVFPNQNGNKTNRYEDDAGRWYEIQFDGNNRVLFHTNCEGTAEYTYDGLDRVVKEKDRMGGEYLYEYDGETGNKTKITYPDNLFEKFEYSDPSNPNFATKYTQRDGSTLSYSYDAHGNCTYFKDAKGIERHFEYDSSGFIKKATDAMGIDTHYVCDSKGNVVEVKVTDPSDNQPLITLCTYDNAGRLKSITSPLGNELSYDYTDAGKLVTETDSANKSTTLDYSGNGYLLKEQDRRGNTSFFEYYIQNDISTMKDQEGGKTLYTYDTAGNLKTTVDADLHKVTTTFDTLDRLESVKDGKEYETKFSYDALGRMTKRTDPYLNNYHIGYDNVSNVWRTINERGAETLYFHDAMGRVLEMHDPLYDPVKGTGGKTHYTYDDNSNLTSTTDPDGNTTEFEYDDENRLILSRSPEGHETEFKYNDLGQLYMTVDAENGENETVFDKDVRPLLETDPMKYKTKYEYDEAGRVKKIIHDDYSYIEYKYDGNGNVLQARDRRGNWTLYTYYKNNLLWTVTDPELEKTTYTYTGNGSVKTIKDARGSVTTYTYDENNNVKEIKDARNNSTYYQYDKLNRLEVVIDSEGNETYYEYDKASNVKMITRPTGGEFKMEYDLNDRMTSATDSLGKTESFEYYKNGLLKKYTNRRGFATSYEYYDDGLLKQVKDALGGTTVYTYDGNGNILTVKNKLNDMIGNQYDANNRLKVRTNELLHEARYEYDAFGRIVKEIREDGSFILYSYDGNGNVLSITGARYGVSEPPHTTTFVYDGNNRITKKIDPEGGVTEWEYYPTGLVWKKIEHCGIAGHCNGKHVTVCIYDANGNLSKVIDPEGYMQDYTYNKNNQPWKVTDKNCNETEFLYDGNGNIREVHHPDGGIERFVYDTNDQLKKYTDGENFVTGYRYDENGNLVKVITPRLKDKNVPGVYYEREAFYDELDRLIKTINEEGGEAEFAYDAMDRLIWAKNEDGAITEYTRDAKGRATEIKDALGHFRYITYDEMDRIIKDKDENGVERFYEYDARGNLTKYTDGLGKNEYYVYDKNDRLVTFTDRRGNSYKYTYDEMNRIKSERNPQDGVSGGVKFNYDKNGRLVEVIDRNGGSTRYVLDGNGNIIELIDAMGHSSYFEYDAMNRLIKIRLTPISNNIATGNDYQMTLYTYDKRGLVKTEVNAAGNGKAMVYDEVGNLIILSDEDGNVTEYSYTPVNLVGKASYQDGKQSEFRYDGTGDLVFMEDWNGETDFTYDLLDRLLNVSDHNDLEVGYVYDNVGNTLSIRYPDGTQADYYYDAENRQKELVDTEDGLSKFGYDANGNLIEKEYPHGDLAYYFYNAANRLIQMDEYQNNGTKLFKTTYSYDAEGNRLSEIQYNHGQSISSNPSTHTVTTSVSGSNVTITIKDGAVTVTSLIVPLEKNVIKTYTVSGYTVKIEYSGNGVKSAVITGTPPPSSPSQTMASKSVALPFPLGDVLVPSMDPDDPIVLNPQSPPAPIFAEDPLDDTASGVFIAAAAQTDGSGITVNNSTTNAMTPDPNGGFVNPGGNYPPGQQKPKPGNNGNGPNKPGKDPSPGNPNSGDNRVHKNEHHYTYDANNRVITGNVGGTQSTYQYDKLGNLTCEINGNTKILYDYNKLNQLVERRSGNKNANPNGYDVYTFGYDLRGNRISDDGPLGNKKSDEGYVYDATNHMVLGTNWKGETSAYTYNGLFVRINNTQTTANGNSVYARDYVIDYTSIERNDLMVLSPNYYTQKHVYTDKGERIVQYTDATPQTGSQGGLIKLLYVHEDIMGNTRYYSKTDGSSFSELVYDVWGAVTSPNKLNNNDNGNFAAANFTGHPYDTVLDVYFADARFYDAKYRTWMAMDPIKDGLNWYKYCENNPATCTDPTGLAPYITATKQEDKESGDTIVVYGFFASDTKGDSMYAVLSNAIPFGGFLMPWLDKQILGHEIIDEKMINDPLLTGVGIVNDSIAVVHTVSSGGLGILGKLTPFITGAMITKDLLYVNSDSAKEAYKKDYTISILFGCEMQSSTKEGVIQKYAYALDALNERLQSVSGAERIYNYSTTKDDYYSDERIWINGIREELLAIDSINKKK